MNFLKNKIKDIKHIKLKKHSLPLLTNIITMKSTVCCSKSIVLVGWVNFSQWALHADSNANKINGKSILWCWITWIKVFKWNDWKGQLAFAFCDSYHCFFSGWKVVKCSFERKVYLWCWSGRCLAFVLSSFSPALLIFISLSIS